MAAGCAPACKLQRRHCRLVQGGVSVWLNGPPTLLAHRVVGDGTETRPLLSQVRYGAFWPCRLRAWPTQFCGTLRSKTGRVPGVKHP